MDYSEAKLCAVSKEVTMYNSLGVGIICSSYVIIHYKCKPPPTLNFSPFSLGVKRRCMFPVCTWRWLWRDRRL